MIRIALIDVDNHNFPSLPLMKLSAWHRQQGDDVEWYDPLRAWKSPPDLVYMSKVFTFTPDYPHPVSAGEIIRGGTGYSYPDGKPDLLPETEHIYPDYSLYPEWTKDTAYGFLTRGCDFCIVGEKEGKKSRKVADLEEFWHGQKNIVLLDPNFFACQDWRGLAGQLIGSRAWIDFSQGCDIRTMTAEKTEYLGQMHIKRIHFAWDRYGEKDLVIRKLEEFRRMTGWGYWKMGVYILTNFDTTFEQDLERVYILRDLGYNPYVMIYNKQDVPKGHALRRLQRWVNARAAFRTVKKFEDFK